MALKTLGAKAAAALDQELMSTGAFSLDQLMELAGLSVSQAVYRVHPLTNGRRILVACGPGNNGGDGLVAARHLFFYGYKPTVFYPKRSKNELYQRLAKQLEDLEVPFINDFHSAIASTDHVVDAIFGSESSSVIGSKGSLVLTNVAAGFSFSGEVREPFPSVIQALQETKLPVTSVDAPSSWDIENGPPKSGLGSSFMPLHRFVSQAIAKKYDFDVPEYQGIDQVVEVGNTEQKL